MVTCRISYSKPLESEIDVAHTPEFLPAINEIYAAGLNQSGIGGVGGGRSMLFYADEKKNDVIENSLKDKLLVPFGFENTDSKIVYF